MDTIPLEEAARPDSRLRESLRGFGVTITTPFSRDGRHLDLSGLDANVRWLVKAGSTHLSLRPSIDSLL